ncbi:MAG: hypothetical protein HDQ97_11880 [Lachnospiraceae bacterium]|nr:hypothetical protein [Lachnospiraceae bacterium]
MEWNVQLKTKGLEQWVEETEQKLTRVRDLLDVLEMEEDTLKNVWKSNAMQQWEREFYFLLAGIRMQVKEVQKRMLVLGEMADSLIQIEKEIMHDVEKL